MTVHDPDLSSPETRAANPCWSPVVHRLTPYIPGEQPKLSHLIKLNTNENPYGPSPRVLEAIQEAKGKRRAKAGEGTPA